MTNEAFAGLELLNVKDEGNRAKINSLIYGDSDTGKTRLVGTAGLTEMFSPVLHLDLEKGRSTLGELSADAQLDVVEILRWAQLQTVYDRLYDEIAKGTCKYRTVNIDNGTYAQGLGMYKLIGVEDYKFDSTKLAEFKDFNGNTEQMKRMVRAFRDLDIHFFMTAHAEIAEDPKTRLMKNWPAFTNKLMRAMPGMFSQVFYMYKEEGKNKETQRVMQTMGTATTTAKCREIELPPLIVDPHMQEIADAPIKESK